MIDFGSADFIPTRKQDYFTEYRGTLVYTPPEILDGASFRGLETDIWALGVLLHILAFSFPPFRTCNDIKAGKFSKPHFSRSDLLVDLVHTILNPDPLLRPSCEQVLAHPWFLVE